MNTQMKKWQLILNICIKDNQVFLAIKFYNYYVVMKLFLIHTEWSDECIIDSKTNQIVRKNKGKDKGNFIEKNNKTIEIYWIKWKKFEVYKKINDLYIIESFYDEYKLENKSIQEFTIIHDEWYDNCLFIKEINMLFQKNKLIESGYFQMLDNHLLQIEWKNWNIEYYIFAQNKYYSLKNIQTKISKSEIIYEKDNDLKNNQELIKSEYNETIDDYTKINTIQNTKVKTNVINKNREVINQDRFIRTKNDLYIDNSFLENKKNYHNTFRFVNNKYYSLAFIEKNNVPTQKYSIYDNIIQKKRASTLINIELLKNWNKKNKTQKISKQKLTLFENLDVYNPNYINLLNFSKFKRHYLYDHEKFISNYFTFQLPFVLNVHRNNENNQLKNNIENNIEKNIKNKKIVTIAEWGYPPFGGGENWLLNMNKLFSNNGYENYFLCFSDPFLNQTFQDFSLVDLEYVKIIQMPKNILDIIKLLLYINPLFINHQGVNRLYFMKIANILQIPFLTGFCFWNNILDNPHANIDILNNDSLQKDESFHIIHERSYCYASSQFVNDIIDKFFNTSLDVIETISLKDDYYIKDQQNNEQVYVTLINCHFNKGGFLLEMLCNELDIQIPILIIYTEHDHLLSKSKIIQMIDQRNKRAKEKNVKYLNIFLSKKQEIKNIYEKTKILLIPSLCDETFCRVGYEGMMNNIPIISTKQGNLKYLLNDYALFLKDDVSTWQKEIEKLYFLNDNAFASFTNKNLDKKMKQIELFIQQNKKNKSLEKDEEKKCNANNSIQTQSSKFIQFIRQYEENINQSLLNIIGTIENNLTQSKYKFEEKHVGIIIPWADQGLGIQGRSYYLSLQEIGFIPYIFSFRPYHANEKNNRLQNKKEEWDFSNVYYSQHNREEITYDEIIDFVYSNKIKKIIFIECTFENIFKIAALLKIIGIEIYLIVNIECIQITELNYHYLFDKILCNNFNSYYLLNDLMHKKKNNIHLLNFHLEENYFYQMKKEIKREFTNKQINNKNENKEITNNKNENKEINSLSFVCIGGLNSISRKNIDKIIELFYTFFNDYYTELSPGGFNEEFLNENNFSKIDISLYIYIQGVEIPEILNQYKHPKIHIKIDQLSHHDLLYNLSVHDIFIHLGCQEGLGLGFYESLYCGVPILTLDWTPNNEIIKDQKNGWLIPCDYDNIYENEKSIIYRGKFIKEEMQKKLYSLFQNQEETYNIINQTIRNRIKLMNENKKNFHYHFERILSTAPYFD